ncbi:protein of unknown function [Thermomonospora echinospora]|uniref:DUF1206 domain-containing protein n=1 Tax=Thermomonospora echinospora TaxID=1992 RepID=A0A1H5UWF1_9ACTN|nr:DUF1206 domain-containing protein [Thermomonospora echinospora]SEF79300.1 protein of unknown function [Thermomonospora echinospora]
MAVGMAGNDVRRAGRQAAGHPLFHRLSRAGLAAKGVIYLLIGLLAVQIGLGDTGEEADKSGALQTVADKPGGTVVLWLLVIGFAGLALWRYAESAYGQPGPDGRKATKRLASLARAVFYTVSCLAILAFVLGQGTSSSDDQSKEFTAKAMAEPGGRWLVLAVGLGFVGWGVGNIVNAARRKFLDKLNTGQMSSRTRKTVKVLGIVGRSARGLVFGAVGVFLAHSAITFDPDKAKGVDGTLREFADTPAGPWALVAVALGLVTYGLYTFCEARWRKIEVVRSGR